MVVSYSLSPLHALAYVFFGEDSAMFGPDPDSIIKFASEGAEGELIGELETVMASNPSEGELKEMWEVTYKSGFHPGSVGLTYRGWFEHMLDVLRADSQC